MNKFLVATGLVLLLAGCATPQQNAALAGAIVGATVAGAVYNPPQVYHQPKRIPQCRWIRGGFAGYDAYGNPMFKYHQVCN